MPSDDRMDIIYSPPHPTANAAFPSKGKAFKAQIFQLFSVFFALNFDCFVNLNIGVC